MFLEISSPEDVAVLSSVNSLYIVSTTSLDFSKHKGYSLKRSPLEEITEQAKRAYDSTATDTSAIGELKRLEKLTSLFPC